MEDDNRANEYNSFVHSVNADGNTFPDYTCEQSEEREACDTLIESCLKTRRLKPKPFMKPAGRSEGRRYYSRR